MKDCRHRDENFRAVLIGSRNIVKRLFVHGVFLTISLFVRNTTVMATNKRYYVINYCRSTGLLPAAAVI